MAMNKAEKKLVEDLQTQVALLSSWRLTDDVTPDVLHSSLNDSPYTSYLDGWVTNPYTKTVSPCRTWLSDHQIYIKGRECEFKNRSQGGAIMYSTEVKALKALRRQLELKYMRELSKIDSQIKELEG